MDTINHTTEIEPAAIPATATTPAKRTQKRRKYTTALKREMVEATLNGAESVSMVARRYDINANQLFKWRQLYREGLLKNDSGPSALIPVTVSHSKVVDRPPSTTSNRIEIHLAQGHRVVITGTVCPLSLGAALEALSA